MELVVALLLFLALLFLGVPIWAIVAGMGAKREAAENRERLRTLELRFEALLRRLPKADQAIDTLAPAPSPTPPAPSAEPAADAARGPISPPPIPGVSPRTLPVTPPPLPPPIAPPPLPNVSAGTPPA